ncbi:hypothetical protein FB567DRAFT_529701 [Paraphoma chrysanthemicola]|uniref:Uncharacterized protein n=1 Tax=Paraphoma chrysanthemicola TaxID=798071 RepID=A0A8K0R440_9PLEO|nr:hypothetical protein FB567DRAFT_529701 [Paraphoma chrysanthemicola]
MSSTTTSSWAPARRAYDKVHNKVRKGSLRKPKPPASCWPEPERSIGAFEAKIGENSYWQVVGPAREAWTKIFPHIKFVLESCTEPIANSPPTWTIRMVGHEPANSAPTILFLCESEPHRKAACKAIKRSDILNCYKGIRLAHMPRAPGSKYRLVPMSSLGLPVQSALIRRSGPSSDHIQFSHAENILGSSSGQSYPANIRAQPRSYDYEDQYTRTHQYDESSQDGILSSDDHFYHTDHISQDVPRTVEAIPSRHGPTCMVYGSNLNIRPGNILYVESVHQRDVIAKVTCGGAI